MNCDAIVSKGNLAWLPRKNATNLDVLHMHDRPLIGTFEVNDCRVLFACLTGATSRVSIWGYLPLTATMADSIDTFDCDSTADLEEYLHGMFTGHRAVFAIAKDERIQKWGTDVVDDEGVLEATIRFMDVSLAKSSTSAESAKSRARQAEQARVDATRQVLEPA